MKKTAARWGAATLSLLILFTQVLFSPAWVQAAELDFWRGRQLQRTSIPTIASIPTPAQSFPFLKSSIANFAHLDSHSTKRSAQPTIVLLQDVHHNVEAQRNIGEILKRTENVVIGVEAAAGAFDFKPYRTFPVEGAAKKIGDYLLANDTISGTSWAGLTAEKELGTMMGVDDSHLYIANVHAYQKAAPLQETAQKEIASQFIGLEKSAHQNKLFTSLLAFHRGQTTIQEYLAALSVDDLTSAPNIKTFVDALALEKQLDLAQAEKQRDLLMATLAHRDPQAVNKLTQTAQAVAAGQISPIEFYSQLKINSKQYPALDLYVRYLKMADSMDRGQLFVELASLRNQAIEKSTNKDLLKKLVATMLAEKLVKFELTPEEWTEYQSVIPAKAGIQSFQDFYKLAESRNEKMAENLLAALVRGKKQTGVLVAGGFHTAGLAPYFRQKGFEVIVITPKFDVAVAGNGSDYLKTFLRNTTPLTQIMSGEKVTLGDSGQAVAAVKDIGLGRTTGKLSAIFLAIALAASARVSVAQTNQAIQPMEANVSVETMSPASSKILVNGEPFAIRGSAFESLKVEPRGSSLGLFASMAALAVVLNLGPVLKALWRGLVRFIAPKPKSIKDALAIIETSWLIENAVAYLLVNEASIRLPRSYTRLMRAYDLRTHVGRPIAALFKSEQARVMMKATRDPVLLERVLNKLWDRFKIDAPTYTRTIHEAGLSLRARFFGAPRPSLVVGLIYRGLAFAFPNLKTFEGKWTYTLAIAPIVEFIGVILPVALISHRLTGDPSWGNAFGDAWLVFWIIHLFQTKGKFERFAVTIGSAIIFLPFVLFSHIPIMPAFVYGIIGHLILHRAWNHLSFQVVNMPSLSGAPQSPKTPRILKVEKKDGRTVLSDPKDFLPLFNATRSKGTVSKPYQLDLGDGRVIPVDSLQVEKVGNEVAILNPIPAKPSTVGLISDELFDILTGAKSKSSGIIDEDDMVPPAPPKRKEPKPQSPAVSMAQPPHPMTAPNPSGDEEAAFLAILNRHPAPEAQALLALSQDTKLETYDTRYPVTRVLTVAFLHHGPVQIKHHHAWVTKLFSTIQEKHSSIRASDAQIQLAAKYLERLNKKLADAGKSSGGPSVPLKLLVSFIPLFILTQYAGSVNGVAFLALCLIPIAVTIGGTGTTEKSDGNNRVDVTLNLDDFLVVNNADSITSLIQADERMEDYRSGFQFEVTGSILLKSGGAKAVFNKVVFQRDGEQIIVLEAYQGKRNVFEKYCDAVFAAAPKPEGTQVPVKIIAEKGTEKKHLFVTHEKLIASLNNTAEIKSGKPYPRNKPVLLMSGRIYMLATETVFAKHASGNIEVIAVSYLRNSIREQFIRKVPPAPKEVVPLSSRGEENPLKAKGETNKALHSLLQDDPDKAMAEVFMRFVDHGNKNFGYFLDHLYVLPNDHSTDMQKFVIGFVNSLRSSVVESEEMRLAKAFVAQMDEKRRKTYQLDRLPNGQFFISSVPQISAEQKKQGLASDDEIVKNLAAGASAFIEGPGRLVIGTHEFKTTTISVYFNDDGYLVLRGARDGKRNVLEELQFELQIDPNESSVKPSGTLIKDENGEKKPKGPLDGLSHEKIEEQVELFFQRELHQMQEKELSARYVIRFARDLETKNKIKNSYTEALALIYTSGVDASKPGAVEGKTFVVNLVNDARKNLLLIDQKDKKAAALWRALFRVIDAKKRERSGGNGGGIAAAAQMIGYIAVFTSGVALAISKEWSASAGFHPLFALIGLFGLGAWGAIVTLGGDGGDDNGYGDDAEDRWPEWFDLIQKTMRGYGPTHIFNRVSLEAALLVQQYGDDAILKDEDVIELLDAIEREYPRFAELKDVLAIQPVYELYELTMTLYWILNFADAPNRDDVDLAPTILHHLPEEKKVARILTQNMHSFRLLANHDPIFAKTFDSLITHLDLESHFPHSGDGSGLVTLPNRAEAENRMDISNFIETEKQSKDIYIDMATSLLGKIKRDLDFSTTLTRLMYSVEKVQILFLDPRENEKFKNVDANIVMDFEFNSRGEARAVKNAAICINPLLDLDQQYYAFVREIFRVLTVIEILNIAPLQEGKWKIFKSPYVLWRSLGRMLIVQSESDLLRDDIEKTANTLVEQARLAKLESFTFLNNTPKLYAEIESDIEKLNQPPAHPRAAVMVTEIDPDKPLIIREEASRMQNIATQALSVLPHSEVILRNWKGLLPLLIISFIMGANGGMPLGLVTIATVVGIIAVIKYVRSSRNREKPLPLETFALQSWTNVRPSTTQAAIGQLTVHNVAEINALLTEALGQNHTDHIKVLKGRVQEICDQIMAANVGRGAVQLLGAETLLDFQNLTRRVGLENVSLRTVGVKFSADGIGDSMRILAENKASFVKIKIYPLASQVNKKQYWVFDKKAFQKLSAEDLGQLIIEMMNWEHGVPVDVTRSVLGALESLRAA